MSYRARLIHDLAIVAPTHEVSGDVDDYGQPVAGEPEVDLVPGLVQPKTDRQLREAQLTSQAGAALSDHTVFLQPDAPVTTAAYIRYHPDDGDRFEVIGVRVYNFGRSPHLEVDCRRVVSEALVTS